MRFCRMFLSLVLCLIVCRALSAQETTGGLQGTIHDPSGAVVPAAKIEVTAKSLIGSKSVETDENGYYRFANLPPDTYTISVTAKGFATAKREVAIDVGRLPSIDITLQLGQSDTIIEVTTVAPQIDVTTNVTTTNVTDDIIAAIP